MISRITILFSTLTLSLLSQTSFAAPCTLNQNPTADCDELLIDGGLTAGATITIPDGITVFQTAGTGAVQVDSTAPSFNFINSGNATIEGNSVAFNNMGTIESFNNSGQISIATPSGIEEGILNFTGAHIGTLTNSGSISAGVGIYNTGATINTLSNTGSITGVQEAILITGTGSQIGSIINSGSISSTGPYNAIYINNATGTSSDDVKVDSIVNTGTLSSTYAPIKLHGSYVGSLLNSGTIVGDVNGIEIIDSYSLGKIDVITNTGTIKSGNGTGPDLYINSARGGNVQTLNNAQNRLTFNGWLPTNYNVIINSMSDYGSLQRYSSSLQLNGTTTFGVYSGSNLQQGTYSSVLVDIDSSYLANQSGDASGTLWQLVETSPGVWDLVVDLSYAQTAAAVQTQARGLAAVQNLEFASMQSALDYRCDTYSKSGVCVSAIGKRSYHGDHPTADLTTAGVVLSFKATDDFVVGLIADRNINYDLPRGFDISGSRLMLGTFLEWQDREAPSSLSLRLSAVTVDSDLGMTRTASTNSEAGKGEANVSSAAYQLVASFDSTFHHNIWLTPYVGLQYAETERDAYTETSTSDVSAPLSFEQLSRRELSAFAGLKLSSSFTEKVTGRAKLGLKRIVDLSVDDYKGTSSISGLDSFSYKMPNNRRTLATASAGLSYSVGEAQSIAFDMIWQEQAYQHSNTLDAMVSYSQGF